MKLLVKTLFHARNVLGLLAVASGAMLGMTALFALTHRLVTWLGASPVAVVACSVCLALLVLPISLVMIERAWRSDMVKGFAPFVGLFARTSFLFACMPIVIVGATAEVVKERRADAVTQGQHYLYRKRKAASRSKTAMRIAPSIIRQIEEMFVSQDANHCAGV